MAAPIIFEGVTYLGALLVARWVYLYKYFKAERNASDKELSFRTIDVYRHPLFWNSDKKLSFLRDASDIAEGNKKGQLSKELRKLQDQVIGSSWDTKIDSKLFNAIEDSGVRFYRQYNYNNFVDLLRLVRNYYNHFHELQKEIQELLGPKPGEYYEYFEKRFPKLLIEVYNVVRKFGKEEEGFKKYFHNN